MESDKEYILAVYLILFGIIVAVMAVSQPDSAEPPYFAGPPDERARMLQWIFCFEVMYLPESMFVHTYVNTDSMNLLSVAIIIYAWVRAYQDGFDAKASMILSLGIVLCALSYYNAYGYILSSILLFLGFYLKSSDFTHARRWRSGTRYRRRIRFTESPISRRACRCYRCFAKRISGA